MFKKEASQKQIFSAFFYLFFLMVFILLISLLEISFFNEIMNSSESIFGKILMAIFALFIAIISIFCIVLLSLHCYHSLKQIFEVRKANTLRKIKVTSLSLFLLIWFTSAQGIYNRIMLGPRDNEVMATYLHEKSLRTSEYRIGAICLDGWYSSATGRGACSWHGGVKEWRYRTEKYYSKSYEKCKIEAEQMSLLDFYIFN